MACGAIRGTDMRSVETCKGCGACYNVCPYQAITMSTDQVGFLKFEKNMDLCKHCGTCDSVCVALDERKPREDFRQQVFAVWAKSTQIHQAGNSGGFFEVAARAILKENGVVVGASYDASFRVKLTAIKTLEKLSDLIGSKFVQSNPGMVYQDVRNYLEKGKIVLFAGAPCQVKALLAVLGRNYPTLITAQFPCFGMPPESFWKKYLFYIGKDRHSRLSRIGSEVQLDGQINTRYMTFSWENGDFYSEKADSCAYIRAWNNGFSVSDVCASCRDNVLPGQSDFIMGNFWHIGEIEKFEVPKEAYEDGVSMLFVNSERGKQFFEKIQHELIVYPRKVVEAVAPHFVFQCAGREHFLFRRKYNSRRRVDFQKELSVLSYEDMEEKYFPKGERNRDVSITRKLGSQFAAWAWRVIYYIQKLWMEGRLRTGHNE